MRVRIYQINTDRDKNRIKFEGFDRLEKYQGSSAIEPSIYDEVFNAETDEMDLEEIYYRFNTEGHPLFRGHSLSVSDVVVVENTATPLVGKIRFYNSPKVYEECSYTDFNKFREAIREANEVGRLIEVEDLQGKNIPSLEAGAYFCDSVGFRKVDFDESLTQKPKNLMRVVYVEPGKLPYEAEIEDTLEAKQKAVGGLIEAVYNADGDTCIVCNDEGKLIGMQGNRRIGDGSSIIAGPFFVCGLSAESFRSLTDEEVVKYMDRFAEPEFISQDEVQEDTGFTFIPM